MIGIHFAMTLPVTEVEIIAPPPHGNHPVAQHTVDKECEHAHNVIFLVAQRTRFANARNLGAHCIQISGETAGKYD
jgi:hypothetical protein